MKLLVLLVSGVFYFQFVGAYVQINEHVYFLESSQTTNPTYCLFRARMKAFSKPVQIQNVYRFQITRFGFGNLIYASRGGHGKTLAKIISSLEAHPGRSKEPFVAGNSYSYRRIMQVLRTSPPNLRRAFKELDQGTAPFTLKDVENLSIQFELADLESKRAHQNWGKIEAVSNYRVPKHFIDGTITTYEGFAASALTSDRKKTDQEIVDVYQSLLKDASEPHVWHGRFSSEVIRHLHWRFREGASEVDGQCDSSNQTVSTL